MAHHTNSNQLELFPQELLRPCELHELERRRGLATAFDEGWDVAAREERLGVGP